MSTQPERAITVTFPADLYSLAAVKKAAYRFMDRATVDIRPTREGLECILQVAERFSATDLEAIVEDFKAEVLDQDLRESIAAETAPMRNAILAFAFSKTHLQSE